MRQDRFLLGILAGIGILAVLAVALFFLRRGTLEYGPETTPEGVTRNYIVALKKGDYERAFSYLGGLDPMPTTPDFIQSFRNQSAEIASTGAEVGQAIVAGSGATVQISMVHSNSGLFAESYRDNQNAELTQENGSWKIKQMPYPFWNYAWVPPVKAQPTNP